MPENEAVHEKMIDAHHTTKITWTWSTVTNEFTVDSSALYQHIPHDIEVCSIEQLLALFSIDDKKLIISILKQALEGKAAPPVKASLIANDAHVNVVVFSVEKTTNNQLSGTITPLFASPSFEELSFFFHQIFENSHHGMLIADADTQIIACNSQFEKTSGYRVDELIGKKTNIFNSRKHEPRFFEEMWSQIDKQGYWNGLVLNRKKNGTAAPHELLIQRLTSIHNRTYYLGVSLDVSDTLYRFAGVEHGGIELLTQLPSSDEYYRKVEATVTRLEADQGLLVLSFVPVFEKENEFEYKRQLASALAHHEDNVVPGFLKKSVFSIAIAYERTTDKPHSACIYDTIKERFKQIRKQIEPNVYARISKSTIGVSVFGLDAHSTSRLIAHSLQAMYEKHSSNNNICFYNHTLHEKMKKRDELEKLVIDAIKNNTIEIYFQPIVNSENWTISKFEALCRFKDPQGNILNTEEMISVAESLDVISDLDLLMAKNAVASRPILTQAFGDEIEVSINVSLNSSKPMKTVFKGLMDIFADHKEHIPFITLELTESAYFDSSHEDTNLLAELRKEGLDIAIDDFGTGYSSFAYLKDSQFDLLKIDREFIKNITVGDHNYHIVKMITTLAHTLGVKVVAEGVETLLEATVLKGINVDFMQGFYFAKPQPVEYLLTAMNYQTQFQDLQQIEIKKPELFLFPPCLEPSNNLVDLKAIFDQTDIHAVPIVLKKKCVGVVTREIFNLHASLSLGTKTETRHDYSSRTKPVSAMMRTTLVHVHKTINTGELHEKIRNKYQFPWIGIDDNGHYFGIIESDSALNVLNEL